MCLNAYKNDIPTQGRISAGVRGIALSEGDYVVYRRADRRRRARSSSRRTAIRIKKIIASQIDPMARYRKGVKVVDLGGKRKVIYSDYVTEPYKIRRTHERQYVRRAGGYGRRYQDRGPHHKGQKHQAEKGLQTAVGLLVDEVYKELKGSQNLF